MRRFTWKRKKAYYREIPLEYQAEEYDGRERKSYFFKTGNTYLELGGSAENNWQTEKAAKKQAIQRLYIYEEKLIEKGVQISANNVKIEVDHKTCISKGFLEIIEKIGRETPVEIPEQPAERTTEDG